MNKYLMTMKPVNTFFFGQESKYRKKIGKTEYEADYFQVSAFFPQQTTVLGMLRYFILQENGQIPIKKKDIAEGLIGKSSFKVTDDNLDFKKIVSLSPVFIKKGDENYFQNPLDLVLRKKDKCKSDSQFIVEKLERSYEDLKTNLPNKKNKMILFKEYKEKEGLSNFLINMKNQKNYLVYTKDDDKEKYIFEKVEKVGINKKETDKAYYKQITYKFRNNDISFACIVQLDMDLVKNKKYKAFLGAERSLFELQFEKVENNFEQLFELEKFNQPKIVLTSDAFIENDTFEYSFSISKTKTFRFLTSEVIENGTYGKFNKKGGVTRIDGFNLFSRGSVFYFDDNDKLNDFEKKLINSTKEKNFYKIGYNYFKTF